MNNDAFIKYIDNEQLSSLIEMKEQADHLFFNTGQSSCFTDERYDLLIETINERYPEHVHDTTVGAKLRDNDNRIRLPKPLWSMDKASDEKKLNNWIHKNEMDVFIIEEKLDGVSCLIVYENGKQCKLYTRGDGKEGADISYLSHHLHNIPQFTWGNMLVRGELIIPKEAFATKYADTFANARNMVSGCVNAKTLRPGVSDIHFVAYEIISDGTSKSPSDQLHLLKDLKFETVTHHVPNYICTYENMRGALVDMKHNSKYEIDGIIIQPDIPYIRCETGNPKYAIAFKQQFGENIARTVVVAIHWEISKWKQIKPRVEIEPVELAGVVIKFVTAYNARYVVDNALCTGSVVDVTRSGDVIPKIVTVIKSAGTPDMPTIKYIWNETRVDICTVDDELLSEVKMTAGFLEKLGAKHVGEKSIQKLYSAGYNTIVKILDMTDEQMIQIDGFAITLAKRTRSNIHDAIKNATIDMILGSSGVLGYGFGIKKIGLLLNEVPDLLTTDIDSLSDRITKVDGFSLKSATKLISHIPQANEFLRQLQPYMTNRSTMISPMNTNPSKNITVVISGFRDAMFEKQLVDMGYKIGSTVSKNTSYVITVPNHNPSSKITKAKSLGISIIDKDDFINQFCSTSTL